MLVKIKEVDATGAC